jgi:hypothetical protein
MRKIQISNHISLLAFRNMEFMYTYTMNMPINYVSCIVFK